MDFINFLDFYDVTDANKRQGHIERLDAISRQIPFEIYSNQDFFIRYRFQKSDRNLIDLVDETLSTHDSRTFHESTLKDRLECLPAKYHILHDRGYPDTSLHP